MAIEEKAPAWRHQLTLLDREDLSINGVMNLGSYDEKEILMETEQGLLTVKGENLNIKQLNLDQGNINIEGVIRVVAYDDAARNKKGLLERLLK